MNGTSRRRYTRDEILKELAAYLDCSRLTAEFDALANTPAEALA
jgi:hypothetical protein